MKGRLLGFAPDEEDCDVKRARHLFRGSVCKCGRVRLTSRYVRPDMTLDAEAVSK